MAFGLCSPGGGGCHLIHFLWRNARGVGYHHPLLGSMLTSRSQCTLHSFCHTPAHWTLAVANLRPVWPLPSNPLRGEQQGSRLALPSRASLATSPCLTFWKPPEGLGGTKWRNVLCSPTILIAARTPYSTCLRAVVFHVETQWYPGPAVSDFRRRVAAMLLSPVEDATWCARD
jgi:hypothetical protein